jgi:tetratricopeptide (TPR) repeat protein
MDQIQTSTLPLFKVRLQSGRVLGPLDLARIRLLIQENEITGSELICKHPYGEWQAISSQEEVMQLLLRKLELGTQQFRVEGAQGNESRAFDELIRQAPLPLSPSPANSVATTAPVQAEVEEEKTLMGELRVSSIHDSAQVRDEKTSVAEPGELTQFHQESHPGVSEELERRKIAQEKTVFLNVSKGSAESKLPSLKGLGKLKKKELIRVLLISLALGFFAYDTFLGQPEKPAVIKLKPIKPTLPEFRGGKANPEESTALYNKAIQHYLKDHVQGYRLAAEQFKLSVVQDNNNVKALAMLASTYLNLIDSSNKDENYFSVISKLIEMSRAKSVDLTETVIADVEFYLTANKPEAAQIRIVDYTKSHPSYGIEMFYYIASTFFEVGEAASAAKYLGQFPDNKVFSAKIFYLKGRIAEKLQDFDAALGEYKKALAFNSEHVKSRLRIAEIFSKKGNLAQAREHLEYMVKHIAFLTPSDLARAFFLHYQLMILDKKLDLAQTDIERAVRLDPENHDYLLEFYSLKAKTDASVKTAQKQARMYFFLSEGEKLIRLGKYQDAMVPLLQARQVDDTSALPLIKLGDMFYHLHNIENAKMNYKLASERAAQNVQVWSKYIKTLIQSYDWDEANQALDQFRKLPVSQSSIEKAAGDIFYQQGKYVDAQNYYTKAMSQGVIDPEVYMAYGKNLMALKNFKDAPFFFALALRFDPLNFEARISSAKCAAETESIDRAISMLQDKLRQTSSNRAEFLGAIAEFYMQKGDWNQAQKMVDQAMEANPDYAYPWKLQALIYMNNENIDRTSLGRALEAYKSFSDRNSSDPSGYLERYKIFVKKSDYEKAKDELDRIFQIYPKYPNLHYYLGTLYAVQGNHKVAVEEFKQEVMNNPFSLQGLMSYGKELIEVGSYQDALAQFVKAMQIAPQSSDPRQNAGWANYQLKNFTAAIALLKSSISMDKGNPLLYKRLGIVYRDMGDINSACANFRKYLEMEPDAPDKGLFESCLTGR